MGYVSGNVPLGTSVSGWLDIIEGLLLGQGWTVLDDQMPADAPNGYRVFKPARQAQSPRAPAPRGYLKIRVDGTTTTLNACHDWTLSAHAPWLMSAGLGRTHDLANGFSYFAEVGPDFVTIFFETTDGVQTPISFGVRLPDWYSPIYKAFAVDLSADVLPVPVCWVAEPHEGTFNTSHAALYAHHSSRSPQPQTWVSADGQSGYVSSSWSYLSHDLGSEHGLWGYAGWSPGMRTGIWSPGMRYGRLENPTSATYFRYAAGFLHTELPGVYRTNSAAANKVAILSDSRDSLIAGYTANYLVDNVTADATSFKLTTTYVTDDNGALVEPHFALQNWPSANGLVKLGDEWVRYASRGGTQGDEFTGVERGLFGTTPESYFGLDANGVGQVSAGLGEWWVKSGRACLYAGYEQP